MCAHCKQESSQLELIRYNNNAFYACDRCQRFFASLDSLVHDPDTIKLMERLDD